MSDARALVGQAAVRQSAAAFSVSPGPQAELARGQGQRAGQGRRHDLLQRQGPPGGDRGRADQEGPLGRGHGAVRVRRGL